MNPTAFCYLYACRKLSESRRFLCVLLFYVILYVQLGYLLKKNYMNEKNVQDATETETKMDDEIDALSI